MLERKHLLKLFLISLAAITVGVTVGLALNYQTIQKLRSEPVEPTPPPVVEEEEKEKIATYSGKVKPAGKLFESASHYLEGGNGQFVALLKSGKIDLSFLEGQNVEVEGKTDYVVEGDQQFLILEVEKVRF